MIWKLIKKDLLRRLKNPAGFLVLVSLPIFFALLLGLVFGPSDSSDMIPQVKLLIEDHDDSFISQMFAGAFGYGELKKMFQTAKIEKNIGRALMDDGKASALLIIPAGFGDSLLNRKNTEIMLIKNPSEAFAPKIAEETINILSEASDRFLRLGKDPIGQIKKQSDSDTDFSDTQIALLAIQTNQLITKASPYLLPPLISLEETAISTEKKESSNSQMYAFLLSGVIVMTLLFTLEAMARDIFQEKENHTLYRLLVGPINVNTYILSKLIYLFIIGLLSYFAVWMIGVILFGIRIPFGQLLPFVIFSVILIGSLVSIISLIYAFARTRQQAQAIAPGVIITFSLLGGSMMPLENLPRFIQNMAVASPVYWSINGLRRILLENAGLGMISTPLLVLFGIAVCFSVPAFMIYNRKFRL